MRISIIGAGVSGLTCGVVLSEAGHHVTIVARELEAPTSAAAAAVWFPYHIASPHADRWAETTRQILETLVDEPGSGVSMIDFELIDTGERLRVALMDTTQYLPYLRRRFRGSLVQRSIGTFRDLDSEVIVNCSGFGARELCRDESMTPGHGLAVLTERPALDRAIVNASDPDSLMYVIPRIRDCVLGGYDQPVAAGEEEVHAIVARCRAALPGLSGDILQVKRGIRPVRPEVRLEPENIDGLRVIHNYGHGGGGFTVSWGCALEVAELLATRQPLVSEPLF